jgi:hypothetical protein
VWGTGFGASSLLQCGGQQGFASRVCVWRPCIAHKPRGVLLLPMCVVVCAAYLQSPLDGPGAVAVGSVCLRQVAVHHFRVPERCASVEAELTGRVRLMVQANGTASDGWAKLRHSQR